MLWELTAVHDHVPPGEITGELTARWSNMTCSDWFVRFVQVTAAPGAEKSRTGMNPVAEMMTC